MTNVITAKFLKDTEERKNRQIISWFECECGKKFKARKYLIYTGRQLGCGCKKGNSPLNITNQRFGKLIALQNTGRKGKNCYFWECQCDCGNIVEARVDYLRNGDTSSCGCIRGESKIKYLTGRKFGRLTVIEIGKQNKSKNYTWKCKCNCGNVAVVSSSNLVRNHTTSCGCLFKEQIGENNPNWNPSLTDENREKNKKITRCLHPDYILWRDSVYKRDNYTCQCCGQVGGKLNAHHIRNYSTYPELRQALSNGITLCKKCHNGFHKKYGRKNNNPWQLTRFVNLYKKNIHE
jgi:hypothetical protein